MEKRPFEKSKGFTIAVCFVLTLVLFAAAFQVMAAPAEVPPERPPAALYAVTWRTTVMSATTNATAVTTQNYAYQDVTCSFDFAGNQDTQRVTVTLQASNDNSGWFQTHEFGVVATDTTATTGLISRTMSYCRYERMRFIVKQGNTNDVTPTCKSVFFNNWMPTAGVDRLDD